MQTTTNTSESTTQKRDLTPFIEQITGQLDAAGAVGIQRDYGKFMIISEIERAFPDEPFTSKEVAELFQRIK